MQTPIKTAIVGYGISAKVFHLPFLITVPGFEVAMILQRNGAEALQLYPQATIVRNLQEILSDASIDLVVITSPNETHFPYAKQSLEAGKHVVVEKPFTITAEEAKTLIGIATSHQRMLSVYQNRRYVSDYLTIKEILQKQLLGEVHEYFAHYDRYRPEAKPNAWREAAKPGSGIFYDLGPHLLDQALCLFGYPTHLTADIRQERPHAKVDDYFMIRLDYEKLKVHLHAGMLVREPGPRYAIHGWKGSFIKYGEDPQEALLRAGQLPVGEHWGKEDPGIYGHLHTEKDGVVLNEKYPSCAGNYGNYYRNLYESLQNGVPQQEKPEQSYNTIRLIELAFESSREKKTVPVTGLIN